MNIELLPGLTNVVRFPVELRVAPSMGVIAEIRPDVREVELVAESFHLELPGPDLRQQVDAQTAAYIAEHILPLTPAEQKAALAELLHQVETDAVAACRRADRVSQASSAAQQRLARVRADGGSWLASLETAAEALTQEAAELLIAAHVRCEEASGVNRAVGLARRGEPWAPFDLRAEEEALFGPIEPRRAG